MSKFIGMDFTSKILICIGQSMPMPHLEYMILIALTGKHLQLAMNIHIYVKITTVLNIFFSTWNLAQGLFTAI